MQISKLLPRVAKQLWTKWKKLGVDMLPGELFLQGALERLFNMGTVTPSGDTNSVDSLAEDVLRAIRRDFNGQSVLSEPDLMKWLQQLRMEPEGTSDDPSENNAIPDDKVPGIKLGLDGNDPPDAVKNYYIRWFVDVDGDDALPEFIEGDKFCDITARAWDHWVAVTRLLLVRRADSESDANVVIRRASVAGGVALAPVAGPGGFNALLVKVDLPKVGTTDKERMEAVLAHEFGHVLGLGHSGVPGSLMNATISNSVLSRPQLGGDDINKIRTIFLKNREIRGFPAGPLPPA